MKRHYTAQYLLVGVFALWMCLVGGSAASITNYAADTLVPSTKTLGYLELSPINIVASAYTFELQLYPRSNTGQCIFSMGDPGTENFFAIQVDNGALVVRVGFPNLPGFVLASSGSSAGSIVSWQTVSVIVRNLNSTNAQVSAFLNGAQIMSATTRQFPTGIRQGVLIGKCQTIDAVSLTLQGPTTLNARVDNFRVWNYARSLAEIQSVIATVDNASNLTSVTNNQNLVAFYPLTEGRGLTTQNIAPGGSTGSVAEIFWVVKDLADFNRTCSAIDNHMSIQFGTGTPYNYDPPQLEGEWMQTSCGPNFAMDVFRLTNVINPANSSCDVTVCAPTVIVSFILKTFDEILNYDFVNLVAGPFTDFESNITRISYSTGIRPTGVRYNFTANSITIEVPTVGYITTNLTAMKTKGYLNQINMNIYHTQFCETKGVTGFCQKSPIYSPIPTDTSFVNMTFCGDQLISGPEQCDGTAQCLDNCMCATGTAAKNGLCTDVCGNSIVTGAEQCDRTYRCSSDCKCKLGTNSVNGKCIDVCGNGIATGTEQCDGGSFCDKCKCIDGYKPTSPLSTSCEVIPAEFVPRVNPSLDCLDVLDNNVARLYFSYENIDGFEQSIPYGKYNAFSPDTFGTTRPTVFIGGKSLAYPLSTYITNVTLTSLSSVSWLLGSFNLTVDLTDVSLLQCPKAPSLEIELATSANLTTADVEKIIDNIADKYDIDSSRINVTVIVNATTQPPTYVLIITISGPTNATEKDASSVISDLFNDLKQNSDDLTKGLEDIDPVIKDVNTRPTGVEVRGQSTGNDNPVLTPVNVSTGQGSAAPKLVALGFAMILLLI